MQDSNWDTLEVLTTPEEFQDPDAEGSAFTTRLLANGKEDDTGAEYMSVEGKMAGLGAQQEMSLRRHIYTHDDIEAIYGEYGVTKTTLKDRLRGLCTGQRVTAALLGYIPIVTVLRKYVWRSDLLNDCIAGVSVAFLHMPMGIALGLLASLPPLQGLLTTFFHVTIYMLFGTCPHVSMGTNALLSLLTANVVDREFEAHSLFLPSDSNASALGTTISGMSTPGALATTEEYKENFKVGVAMSLSFISGAILLGMGLLKFGFLTSFLSASFLGGFTTAAAVHIATSQVPKLFAISIPRHTGAFKWVKTWVDIFRNLGDANPGDAIVGFLSIFILLAVAILINEKYQSKMKVPVPIHLILVIVTTLISHFADFEGEFNIKIVGSVGSGFQAPEIPNTEVMSNIAMDAFIIAILAYAMTISMAKLMAKMHKYDIDDNQELVAYGLCNFASSFFRCHPGCLAPPRTMLLSNAGAKTTANGVFTAIFIFIIIMAAGPLFVSLPIAVLAAMICVAVKNLLLQPRQLPNLWRTHKPDFIIWVSTCLAGILIDLDIGIVVGVGMSIFSIVVLSQLRPSTVRAVSDSEDLVLPGSRWPRTGASNMRGVRVFHFPSQLYFANAEKFKKDLYSQVVNPSFPKWTLQVTKAGSENCKQESANGDRRSSNNGFAMKTDLDNLNQNDVKVIILDCSAMTYIDLAGVNMLKAVVAAYTGVDIVVYLACCPASTVQVLEAANFFQNFPRENVVYDVFDALKAKLVQDLTKDASSRM